MVFSTKCAARGLAPFVALTVANFVCLNNGIYAYHTQHHSKSETEGGKTLTCTHGVPSISVSVV
jgi:hypothetical protein